MKTSQFFKLILAFCLVFSAFSMSVFAAETDDVKVLDAETVQKLYSDLYSKYYPNVVTVTIDKDKFKPVLASTFYEELKCLENYLKEASLPENNIIVDYDENDRIIGLQFPMRFKDEARKYLIALEEQLASESVTGANNILASDIRSTKTTRIRYSWNISLLWGATYKAGFYATYHLSNYNYIHFTSTATDISPYTYYSGLGDAKTNVSVLNNVLLDARRTNSISILLKCHAWVVVNGITQTYRDDLFKYVEAYASSLW